MEEKRSHPRTPVRVEVTCEFSDTSTLAGTAKDISVGGMFIEANTAPAFGTKLTIIIRLPGLKADSRLPAIVRWTNPGGFGVQFGLLGARETHAINSLMRR